MKPGWITVSETLDLNEEYSNIKKREKSVAVLEAIYHPFRKYQIKRGKK